MWNFNLVFETHLHAHEWEPCLFFSFLFFLDELWSVPYFFGSLYRPILGQLLLTLLIWLGCCLRKVKAVSYTVRFRGSGFVVLYFFIPKMKALAYYAVRICQTLSDFIPFENPMAQVVRFWPSIRRPGSSDFANRKLQWSLNSKVINPRQRAAAERSKSCMATHM